MTRLIYLVPCACASVLSVFLTSVANRFGAVAALTASRPGQIR